MDLNISDRKFWRVMRRLNALVLASILLGYLALPTQHPRLLLGYVAILSVPLFLAMHGLRRDASGLSRKGGFWFNAVAGLLATLAIALLAHRYQGIHWPRWWQLPSLIFLGGLAFLSAAALSAKNKHAKTAPRDDSRPVTRGRSAPIRRVEPVFTISDTMVSDDGPIPPDANELATARTAATVSTPATDNVPAPSDAGRRAPYLVRHWRGELSLPVSFWLNSVGISFLFAIGTRIAARREGDAPLRETAIIAIVTLCLFALFSLWSNVGIWRSASRRSRTGGGRGWAITAQLLVLFGVLGHLGNLKRVLLPEINALGLISLGMDPIGKANVRLSSDGRTVYFSGGLRAGSADQVEQILRAAPQAHLLVLDSYGGRLAEARILAHVVEAHGMDTHVEKLCASACTYVLLAGRHRTVAPMARIGFHQPSITGADPTMMGGETEKMLDYYRAAGLPEGFVQRISHTPASSVWYPTLHELQAANVVTVGHGTTE